MPTKLVDGFRKENLTLMDSPQNNIPPLSKYDIRQFIACTPYQIHKAFQDTCTL